MSRSLPPSDLVPLATTMSTPFWSGGTANAHGDAIVVSRTRRRPGTRARAGAMTARSWSKSWARTSGFVNVSANTKRVCGVMAAASASASPSSTTVTEPPMRAASHSR